MLRKDRAKRHWTWTQMGEASAGSRRKRRSAFAKDADTTSPRYFPSRIPGVRIAHVSGRSQAVNDIEVYWQSRGAIFMHWAIEGGGGATGLDPILNDADIVFHSADDINPEMRRQLVAFCERAEKPLIALDESSLSGLAEALLAWSPLGLVF